VYFHCAYYLGLRSGLGRIICMHISCNKSNIYLSLFAFLPGICRNHDMQHADNPNVRLGIHLQVLKLLHGLCDPLQYLSLLQDKTSLSSDEKQRSLIDGPRTKIREQEKVNRLLYFVVYLRGQPSYR